MTIPPRPAIAPADFTGALSLAANGVAIVTTAHGDMRAGLTVSSLCSVCAEPPLILACVQQDNEFCEIVDTARVFAINLLTQHQIALSNEFAGLGEHPDADRFRLGDWQTLATGAPILADALVSLDCELESVSAHGTHRIHIGRVVGVLHANDDQDIGALVYARRQYARCQPL